MQTINRSFGRWATCSRRALPALMALVLGACGGSSSDSTSGTTTLRALNLSTDMASVDLLKTDATLQGALATDAVSGDSSFDSGTYTLKLRRTGSATDLLTQSHTLASGGAYLAVIWGRENAPRLSTLPEDQTDSDITSGYSRLRIMNATIDSGSVDVYVTSASTEIADTTATVGTVTAGSITAFKDLVAGTYRLRVTGAGDPADLRLDVPSITLGSQTHQTFIVTSGASGVLLHGTQAPRRAQVTTLKNTQARVRVLASVDGSGNVGVALGNRTLAGSLRSPSVGPYALVDAGTAALAVRVNGNTVTDGAQSFVAGTDYTLLVHGTLASPQVSRLTDDNRLPTTASRVRVRLVNGTALADPLTLSVDYSAVGTEVANGAASAYYTLVSNTAARVDVTAPSAAAALFSDTSANLQSQGVYSVFMLGGNSTPTGVLRKER